jgi:hypothetical protein
MKQKTLVTGSILAVAIVAIAICVGMVSGYSIFKPFISVDPIGDKNAGDSIILTGKTSLPAGTEILVQVYSASYESGSGTTTDPKTGTVSGEFSGATGTATVVKGTGNVNTWATPLDTKTFKTGEYLVTADSLKGDISKGDYTKGDISGTTKFTLLQTSVPESVDGQFIHVDPVGDKNAGDKFTITGTTNLVAGTEILVQVYAASYESGSGTTTDPKTGTVSGEFSGAVGIVNVNFGTGDTNIWSMELDTIPFPPTQYLVNASVFKGDVKKGDFSTGNPIGKTKFTVK